LSLAFRGENPDRGSDNRDDNDPEDAHTPTVQPDADRQLWTLRNPSESIGNLRDRRSADPSSLPKPTPQDGSYSARGGLLARTDERDEIVDLPLVLVGWCANRQQSDRISGVDDGSHCCAQVVLHNDIMPRVARPIGSYALREILRRPKHTRTHGQNLAVDAAYDSDRFTRSPREHRIGETKLDHLEDIRPNIPSTRNEHSYAIANPQAFPGINCRATHPLTR
jgi:hypothetical protein